MKKNRITFIVVIILLIAAAVLIYSQTDTTLDEKHSQFAVEDTGKITKIYMADNSGAEVLLERTGPNSWQLNKKFKASSPKVQALLETLVDLKVMKPVPASGHNTVVKRMAGASTKVEIYREEPLISVFGLELFPKERASKVYYVGGVTKESIGNYMLMENSEEPFVVYLPNFRGFISPRYSTIEEEWRDHQVFQHRLEDIQAIEMTYFQEPENSYKAYNIDNLSWALIDAYQKDTVRNYDTLKLLSFVTSFEDLRFESLMNDKLEQRVIDSVLSTTPVQRLAIIDKDGNTTEMITYNKKGFQHIYDEKTEGLVMEPFDIERMFAEINEGEDFVMIQNFVFDKVLKPLSYFRKESR